MLGPLGSLLNLTFDVIKHIKISCYIYLCEFSIKFISWGRFADDIQAVKWFLSSAERFHGLPTGQRAAKVAAFICLTSDIDLFSKLSSRQIANIIHYIPVHQRSRLILNLNGMGLSNLFQTIDDADNQSFLLLYTALSFKERDDFALRYVGAVTPFLFVAARGNIEIMSTLLNGISSDSVRRRAIQQRHSSGATPLFFAAQEGCCEVVNSILELLSKEDRDKLILRTLDRTKATALYMAAQNGHHKIVEILIKALSLGARYKAIMHTFDNGSTSTIIAAEQGHDEVVQVLLSNLKKERDAAIMFALDNGATALLLAAQNGHDLVVKSLLNFISGELRDDAICQLQNDDNVTSLFMAAQNGHNATLQVLLGFLSKRMKDKAVTLPNINGTTPLSIAVYSGHLEVALSLISALSLSARDAAILQADNIGLTALMYASERGHVGLVHLLLNSLSSDYAKGKAILTVSNNKCSALKFAALCKDAEILKIFLNEQSVKTLLLEGENSVGFLEFVSSEKNEGAAKVIASFMLENNLNPDAVKSVSTIIQDDFRAESRVCSNVARNR